MGRKSIVLQRQQEILDAFERCLKKHGFSQCSTRRIAEEAGLNQPLIVHYFGNKEALVSALVTRVFDRYRLGLQESIGKAEKSSRLKLALDFLFGSGVLGKEAQASPLSQLLSAAKQDQGLRRQMKTMYEGFNAICLNELRLAYPHASLDLCQMVAYGILCLGIGNDLVLMIGLPYQKRKLARSCAERLLSQLES